MQTTSDQRINLRPSGLSGKRPSIVGFVLQRIEQGVLECTTCAKHLPAGHLVYLQVHGALALCCHCVERTKG